MNEVIQRAVLLWAPVALTVGFLSALAAFAVKSALLGRVPNERVEKAGGSVLLSKYAMEYWYWANGPIIRAAVRLGIHPDAFSWASLTLHALAALLVAHGVFGLGAWVLIIGAFCDAIDGAVARAHGIASDAGEVLDAAIDRWAEMVIFFGYAWYYRECWWGFTLACAACAGAVMTSYARAKGSAYGIDAGMGLMQRHERGVWLAVSTLASAMYELLRPTAPGEFVFHTPVLVALTAIAVLANWSAWLRVRYTRQELRRR